jgi:glyoxylase-like metal-dependent hydrolase (beta-lactamase superfamily II)
LLHLDDVVPICVTEWTAPEDHPLSGEEGQVFAFVIRHPAGLILFETGFGRDSTTINQRFKAVHHSLEDELAKRGHATADVRAIANSHLHFDHCGNNALFPGVAIYVQASEYRAAHEPRYTVPGWVDFPNADYHQIDGDHEIADGVTILATRGHTVGHQSLLVETTSGPIVLAGQAIYCEAEYEYIRATGELLPEYLTPGDEENYLASAKRLINLASRRVLFSHDSAMVESTA